MLLLDLEERVDKLTKANSIHSHEDVLRKGKSNIVRSDWISELNGQVKKG